MNVCQSKSIKHFAVFAAALLSAQVALADTPQAPSLADAAAVAAGDTAAGAASARAVADASRLIQKLEKALRLVQAWNSKSKDLMPLGHSVESSTPLEDPLQLALNEAQSASPDKTAIVKELDLARAGLYEIKGILLRQCHIWLIGSDTKDVVTGKLVLKELREAIASINAAIDESNGAEQDREMAILRTLSAMNFQVKELFDSYLHLRYPTTVPQNGHAHLIDTLNAFHESLAEADQYINDKELEWPRWDYPSTLSQQVRQNMALMQMALTADSNLEGEDLIIREDAVEELTAMIVRLDAAAEKAASAAK